MRIPMICAALFALVSLPRAQGLGPRIQDRGLGISYQCSSWLSWIPRQPRIQWPGPRSRYGFVLSPLTATKKFEKWKKGLSFDPEKRIDWELNVLCGKPGDFGRFVTEKLRPKESLELGTKKRQVGEGKLAYVYWSWNFGTGRARAAVYQKKDLEVVLVVHWGDPGGDTKDKKPASKIRGYWKERMEKGSLPMLETFRWEPTDGLTLPTVAGEKRFLEFAGRRAILDRERARVAGHADWSMLATRRFLVKFSHGGRASTKGRMQKFTSRLLGDYRKQEGAFRRLVPPLEGFDQQALILRVYHPQDGGAALEAAVRVDPRYAVPGPDDFVVQAWDPWKKQSFSNAWYLYLHAWAGGKQRVHPWVSHGLAGELDAAKKKRWSDHKKKYVARMRHSVQEALRSGTAHRWKVMLTLANYSALNGSPYPYVNVDQWYAQGDLMVAFLIHGKDGGFDRQPYEATFRTYLSLCRTLKDPVKAATKAFSKIDDSLLEKDWEAYVEGLKD